MDRWEEQPAAEPIGEGVGTADPWAVGGTEGAYPALAGGDPAAAGIVAGPGLHARGPGDRIRAVTFQTTWRGYVPEQVQAYLGALADQVDAREARIRELEAEVRELREGRDGRAGPTAGRPPADAYEGFAGRVAELMRSLEQEAERLRSEAETEAARAVTTAEEEAARIVAEARAEAERIVREAEAAGAEALARREDTLARLRAVRDALDRVLRSEEPERASEVVVLEDSSANGGARADGSLS